MKKSRAALPSASDEIVIALAGKEVSPGETSQILVAAYDPKTPQSTLLISIKPAVAVGCNVWVHRDSDDDQTLWLRVANLSTKPVYVEASARGASDVYRAGA